MPRVSNKRIKDPAWSEPALRNSRYSHSLERGLAILRCFTAERPVLGNAAIADGLQMGRSTTHRYITTLAALGYLERAASHKYRLGSRVTDLGFAALQGTGLRERAHGYLQELCEETGYAASLGALSEQEVVYVEHVSGSRRLQRDLDPAPVGPGTRLPAYCTAIGKLLLAHLPATDREDLIGGLKLVKHTPTTVTGKRKLLASLQEAVQRGYAVEDEELARGLIALAAPVRDGSGDVVAAVGLRASAAAISIEDLVEAYGVRLIATGVRISAGLGYRGGEQ